MKRRVMDARAVTVRLAAALWVSPWLFTCGVALAQQAPIDKAREKLENEAILQLVESDAKAGGKSLNYAKDVKAQHEFDREFAELQPAVRALGLSPAQHVQAAHAQLLARRNQRPLAKPATSEQSARPTTQTSALKQLSADGYSITDGRTNQCTPGDRGCTLDWSAVEAFIASVGASAPASKQPAKLGLIDTWRYRRCQENAAQAPTQSGVSQGLRLCREQFDQ